MRKFVLIAVVALSACLGLSACNKQGDDQQAQEQVQKALNHSNQQHEAKGGDHA